MGVFEIVTSLFGGGITGLIGGIVQRWADYKVKQLEIAANKERFTHEQAMRSLDIQVMEKEWSYRTTVAQVEAGGREAVADAQAFAASFNEPQRYGDAARATPAQAWLLFGLDFLRGLVRPALTVYLCFVTTVVYLQARGLLASTSMTTDQAIGMVNHIIATVLYLTTTCVLWWFGTRTKQAAPKP